MALSYCGEGTVIDLIAWKQSSIFYEHCHSFEDKCKEQLDVNEVPGTT